jgi:hypothetical protein
MDRAGASRAVIRVAPAAGITHPISPQGLRRLLPDWLVTGIASKTCST